jgi:hypothetical protein
MELGLPVTWQSRKRVKSILKSGREPVAGTRERLRTGSKK